MSHTLSEIVPWQRAGPGLATAALTALVCLLLASPLGAAEAPDDGRIAPLLDGLGDHSHPISSDEAMVQRYFDQGLVLAYAFNHGEAERAFREAARRDPECAICWWGVALVLGPNINDTAMSAEVVETAWEALETARRLAPHASERERAYIEALGERYAPEPAADRSHLDEAYAEAMGELAQSYPEDAEAQALYAEALMDTTPWDYWTADGEPYPVTERIFTHLQAALDLDPLHPLANHLWIHAVEAEQPERGIEAADRLRGLVPGAGHLVHMPSHIYIRVGRYHDAALVNQEAVEADREYLAQVEAQGLYPLAYVPHNWHFLWAAASLEGRGELALEAARRLSEQVDRETMREPGLGTLQHYWATPLFSMVRFGRWEEILSTPRPASDLLYPTGVWHYARGMARLRRGDLDKAAGHLERLAELAADPAVEAVTIWEINSSAELLAIAREVLAGELAATRGNHEEAIARLEEGVRLESELTYDEPPPWHLPVRQVLGAVLLEASRPAEAERVYRKDLERFPDNGWSLHGLAESLTVQGEEEAAAEARERFEAAWRHADVELPASRL